MKVEEPVPFRPGWGRPAPDEYERVLREAVLEAEADDADGSEHGGEYGAGLRRGYAMGLRVAAGLYGMPEGQDPANRHG